MSFSKLPAPCKFCVSQEAKYTCPRCNASYCSLDCYKDRSHEQCSEQFFQEWVISSLRDMPHTNDRTKMLEILKKISREDDGEKEEDEDDSSSMDARFADLNLEDDVDESIIWDRLTDEEKEKFRALLNNEEELGKILPNVHPWWTVRKIKLVKDDGESTDVVDRPPLPIGMKSLSTLSSKKPSECICYNVINVLYAYTFLFRFYHCDLREFHESCVDSFFRLCPVLSENKNYFSLEESVQDSIRLISSEYSTVPMLEIKNLCNDIVSIIKGPENANSHSYMFCALNDIKLLILQLREQTRSSNDKLLKSSKKLLTLTAKKVDFLISWVMDYSDNFLPPLIKNLQLMLLPELIENDSVSSVPVSEGPQKTKTLIEELN